MNKINFREFKTSSGKKVLGGKSAENNEELIAQANPEEIVLHTKSPGSPFVNIKSLKPAEEDIKEAAVFCAAFSQSWKKPKTKPKEILIHVFKGKEIYKDKYMKLGTFGVKKHKQLKVKKEDILKFLKEEK